MSLPDLSVTIITKNEARRLGRCLDSVSFADEIVVVDSGSTDDTVGIARGAGARVTVTDWPGFGPQKNRALELAHGRWVLSIDADEQVTPELRDEILAIVRDARAPADAPQAWWLRRASTFCGRRLRHGDWSNDRVLRLFRRGEARFSDDRVHERLLYEGRSGELRGILLHDTVETLDDAHGKAISYALAGADRVRARGRGGLAAAVGHAGWSFVRGFALRGGFLDGRRGWQLAGCNALGTYLRYRFAGLDGERRAALARAWAARLGLEAPDGG
jgi:glycosyltransferase involved in cell wall biosynthesis